jgi:hypothetical protein
MKNARKVVRIETDNRYFFLTSKQLLIIALSVFRYPMVTYCYESPKLCVGTKTGVLALYDLKTPKYQVKIRSSITGCTKSFATCSIF